MVRDHCISRKKVHYQERFQAMTFLLKSPPLHYQATISRDDFFFRGISKNLGRKLILITMTLRLKVTISHKNFFLLVKYCMSHSLFTHKIPIFMTKFWHANCMAKLRGHRTPLQLHDQSQRSPHATAALLKLSLFSVIY